MRVLVTGAAGYIGAVLCERLLDEGWKVRALDRLSFGGQSLFHLCSNADFEFTQGDVRNRDLVREALADVDVVIPLAAIVGAPACDQDPLSATSINLDAIRMLNDLRSHEQLVVYPTTNSGYGTQSGEMFCTEDTPLQPISLYGSTKVEAERAILDSPNSITLRLATVFGMSARMRLDLLVNHFTYAAVTDGYLVMFEKDFKRNFIHIRDVADCFVHSIRNAERMAGHPYNVGLDDANLSKEELALRIKRYVPNFYIHFASVGTDPDKRNYIVSNERLRQAGFEARRTLDEGIQELIKGYQLLGLGLYGNV